MKKETNTITDSYETSYMIVVGFNLRMDINLTPSEKLLGFELIALDNLHGSYLSDDIIAHFTKQPIESIQPKLEHLEQLGYIKVIDVGLDRQIKLTREITG